VFAGNVPLTLRMRLCGRIIRASEKVPTPVTPIAAVAENIRLEDRERWESVGENENGIIVDKFWGYVETNISQQNIMY